VPSPRLNACAIVTGWCLRDRFALGSGSGQYAVEDPMQFELVSGEDVRSHGGNLEGFDSWLRPVCGSSGSRRVRAHGGWVWKLRRLDRAVLAITAVLGAFEGVRRSYRSPDLIALACCACCRVDWAMEPNGDCGMVDGDRLCITFVS
jgi:hypothetical protein